MKSVFFSGIEHPIFINYETIKDILNEVNELANKNGEANLICFALKEKFKEIVREEKHARVINASN